MQLENLPKFGHSFSSLTAHKTCENWNEFGAMCNDHFMPE